MLPTSWGLTGIFFRRISVTGKCRGRFAVDVEDGDLKAPVCEKNISPGHRKTARRKRIGIGNATPGRVRFGRDDVIDAGRAAGAIDDQIVTGLYCRLDVHRNRGCDCLRTGVGIIVVVIVAGRIGFASARGHQEEHANECNHIQRLSFSNHIFPLF
ncbi:MAG: hypothetical protein IPK83_16745 [Planctomycetes bacterium]|nr:hypothetical protein [Planctomycetota bacterium]